jgi:hypothetical protein
MQIYYSNEGERVGPKKIEDLKPNELEPDMLVWHKGMKEWADASEVPELEAYFEAQPKRAKKDEDSIPLSLEERELIRFKYKLNRVGLSFLLIQVLYILRALMNQHLDGLIIVIGLIIVVRIIALVLINNATNQLQGNSGYWMVFGVFLPGIALIRLSSSDFTLATKSQREDLLDDYEN